MIKEEPKGEAREGSITMIDDPTIKLDVDFYADGFKSGTIEVPKEVESFGECGKRTYIKEVLMTHLSRQRKWSHDEITIITAKYEK